MRKLTTIAALLAWVLAADAAPAATAEEKFAERVTDALASETRSPQERARDANRKPAETLAFFGLRGDMDVLELVPGGGWYTKLLAPALADEGSLSVWVALSRYADRLDQPGLEAVARIAEGDSLESTERRGIYEVSGLSLGREAFDAVLTFRNLHNLTAESRLRVHRAVFAALRPGGVYGVVDHTRRHMQPDDAENRRRLDPVLALHEVLQAGFVLEAFSDLHYRPDDELRYEVGRRSVTGNTDRFTFRFRKPR